MTAIVDTKKISAKEEEEEENNTQNFNGVTSRIYLKQPANAAAGTLEKDVVLRRIRHRRRVNKLKSTVKAFLGFASSKDKRKQSGVNNPPPTSQMISWVDDAFAAP